MKKRLFRLLLVCALLLVLAVAALFYWMGDIIKTGLETAGPSLLKVSVRVDDVRVSPLSGSGVIHGLVLGNPEGYSDGPAMSVKQVSLAIAPMSLFSGTVHVRSVNVDGAHIHYEGGLKQNNLTKILENIESASPSGGGGRPLRIDEFNVRNSKISLGPSMMGGQLITVPMPPMRLTDLGTADNGSTPVDMARRLMTEVLGDVSEAVTEPLSRLGKSMGNAAEKAMDAASDAVKKTGEGIKNLFKKK